MKNWIFFFLSVFFFTVLACQDDESPMDDEMVAGDLTEIPYDPQPYELVVPCDFPVMEIPEDNPLTIDGVELGRFLFYDPILAADSTMSCSSCHLPAGSFTDNLAVSAGIDGVEGIRSSMSLLNIGYVYEGLFWDGRVTTLEEQALLPVEDPIELHNTWPELVDKLKVHDTYPEMFRKAFGISDTEEITKELAAKAIAQFERTLVSSGKSDYHRSKCEPFFFLSDLAIKGEEEFSNEFNDHPGCTHCHKKFDGFFTDNTFRNNALEDLGTTDISALDEFPDLGHGEVTGNMFDNGKFRVPTLHNIAMSAPYMHDGRIATLDEVLDHYASGGFASPNVDPNMVPFAIDTVDRRAALLAFLHTLTDTTFMNNPAHQNPFEE